MYKLLVIALSINTVLSASEQLPSSPMQVENTDENTDLEVLASSFNGLNTVCPPPTPQKPSRSRAGHQALVGADVRRSLACVFKQQANRNAKAQERAERAKKLVRELNFEQMLDMPDNTHLLQAHMHNFTNQVPDGIQRPVVLRFPSLQDLLNSPASSEGHQQ